VRTLDLAIIVDYLFGLIFGTRLQNRKPRLLAAQNSRSFSCAPRFNQVTLENIKKIGVFLSEILISIFRPQLLKDQSNTNYYYFLSLLLDFFLESSVDVS